MDGLSLPVDPSRLSTLQVPVHMPNGMTLGHDGCLVVCEHLRRPRGQVLFITADTAAWAAVLATAGAGQGRS
jgi:hypothetical protein